VTRDPGRNLLLAGLEVIVAVDGWAERHAIGAAVLNDLTDELEAINGGRT